MKYKIILVLVIVVSILFSCNKNNSNISSSRADYDALVIKLDSLYHQNSINPSSQLSIKIEAIEKELLERYPDMVSTEEDVSKEGVEG